VICSNFANKLRYSLVSQFIENAREIFEAAENSAAAGHPSAEYTILLGTPGGIHMIANSDWSLGQLQQTHGAALAYRVSRVNGKVMVDGSDGQRTCHMEATPANKAAQFLLNGASAWHATPSYTALLAA
jgi:hypothetical protein